MNIFLSLLLTLSVFGAPFDWQGHRGARGLMPENTIGAMKEALRYPVTTLELDVVISKDKKVIVSHEPWMNPVICRHPEGKTYKEKEFNLYRMEYAEILRFECGSLPHPRFPEQKKIMVGKPTLGALLLEIEPVLKNDKREVSYNIEIKSDRDQEKKGFQPKVPEFSDLVIKEIRSHISDKRYVIQSFDPRVLKYIHEKYPEVTLSFLSEEKMTVDGLQKLLGFLPAIFSPYFETLSRENVSSFHARNVLVIPWNINRKEEMKLLMAMGVDGIITDYPNLIPEVIVKDCPGKTNFFEGKCVKVPTHAVPSDKNPGWNCKSGYVQRRSHCEKIKVPSHASLNPDGKSWECDPGFERYRQKCRKK